MSNQNNNDPFDLGSDPIDNDFDPFGSESDLGSNTSENTAILEESKTEMPVQPSLRIKSSCSYKKLLSIGKSMCSLWRPRRRTPE